MFPAYIGAGGIVSTAADMMRWLRFHMGMTKSPLNSVIAPMQSPSTTVPGLGIGWFLNTITAKAGGDSVSVPIVWKNGAINGSCSWLGFASSTDPGKVPSRAGMFLLGNNALPDDGGSAAYRVLLTMLGYSNATDVELGA